MTGQGALVVPEAGVGNHLSRMLTISIIFNSCHYRRRTRLAQRESNCFAKYYFNGPAFSSVLISPNTVNVREPNVRFAKPN